MTARLRELAEGWKGGTASHDYEMGRQECAAELLSILDAEGDGHYSQGVCEDGAAILLDGKRMTVDEIVAALNAKGAEGDDWVVGAWQYRRKTYLGWGSWRELNPEHIGAARDREGVEIRALYAPAQGSQVDKCGVCGGPNAYDPESGVCLKCQDVAESDGGEVGAAIPNDDLGHELAGKHHLFIYEVDFGGEGKGRYIRLNDFNLVVAKLEATHLNPARSGVVRDEDVEAACGAFLDNVTDHQKDIEVDMVAMRAALEHFTKGERHER